MWATSTSRLAQLGALVHVIKLNTFIKFKIVQVSHCVQLNGCFGPQQDHMSLVYTFAAYNKVRNARLPRTVINLINEGFYMYIMDSYGVCNV